MTDIQKYQFGKVTGEDKYDTMICTVCDVIAAGQNHFLDMYWQIGDVIYSHVQKQQGDKNVAQALRDICQHVREASNNRLDELQPDALRNALKIRTNFDANQLELAKAGCISLRNLLPMCQNDVTEEEREQYLQEVVEGELDQTELPERVKEDHPPEEREEKRGGARQKKEAPLGFIQRIKKDMDKLITDMDEHYPMHLSTIFGSEDDPAKEEFEKHFDSVTNQVKLFNSLWTTNTAATKAYLAGE